MTQVECKWISAHLDGYISGQCLENEREAAERHLATCVDCYNNVKIWSFLKEEVPTSPLPPLSPMVERRILSGGEDKAIGGSKNQHVVFRTMGVVAALAAVVTFLLIWPSLFSSDVPEMTSIAPPVPELHKGITPVSVRSDTVHGLKTETDPSGKRYIEVVPGTTLWLVDDAAVVVKVLDDSQVLFHLTRGSVVAEIGPTSPGFRFMVETPHQEIEARGTIFSVQMEASGASSVRVAEGTVEVRDPNHRKRTQILSAGQSLPSSAESPVAAGAEELAADIAFIGLEPISVVLDERATPEQMLPEMSPETTPGAHRHTRKISTEQRSSQLLDLAQDFRRSNAYAPAAATYKKIIADYPNSTSAAVSLVSLGQLQLTALKNPGNALAQFERYLKAFPRGNLRAAALSGKIRSLVCLKRHIEVIKSVTAYLSKYPQSGAAPEMLRRRGDAHVALGKSNNAVRDYTRVITQWPNSKEAVRAQKSMARYGNSP